MTFCVSSGSIWPHRLRWWICWARLTVPGSAGAAEGHRVATGAQRQARRGHDAGTNASYKLSSKPGMNQIPNLLLEVSWTLDFQLRMVLA